MAITNNEIWINIPLLGGYLGSVSSWKDEKVIWTTLYFLAFITSRNDLKILKITGYKLSQLLEESQKSSLYGYQDRYLIQPGNAWLLTISRILFYSFFFLFLGHIWQCSPTPGFAFRVYSWQGSGEHIWCQGVNLGGLCASNLHHLLSYLSRPNFSF